jgi:hypothetical protein
MRQDVIEAKLLTIKRLSDRQVNCKESPSSLVQYPWAPRSMLLDMIFLI